MRNHYAVLTDLPDEVLHSIMSNLSDEDLANLAAVSYRFRDVVVLMYFHRVGFKPGVTYLRVGGAYGERYPFDVMKGIFLCGNLGALDELDSEFSANAVWEMEKVRDLVVRVPGVSSLRLWFSGDFLRDTQEAFMKALFGLLDVLPGKSCTSLTITNLFLPALFHPIDQDIHLPPLNTLRVVNLSITTTYMCTPLLDWIVSSLNNSPVRTLRITTNQTWDSAASMVLDFGHLSHLIDFNISPCPSVDRLVLFFSRHPSIQVLNVQLYDLFHPNLSLSLPSLTKLVANAEFAVWLLCSKMAPALHTIHLDRSKGAPPACAKYVKYVNLLQALGVISKFPAIRSLAFDLYGSRVNIAESSNFLSRLKQPVLPRIIHVTLFVFGDVPCLPQWLGVRFPNLETLIYDHSNSMRTAKERLHFLRRFCKACPALSKMSFSAKIPVRPIACWLGQAATNGKAYMKEIARRQ